MGKYIDEYLIIKVDNIEDSHIIQKFLFDIDVYWNFYDKDHIFNDKNCYDKDHIFNDKNCYYIIDVNRKLIVVSHYLKNSIFVKYSDKKLYNINELNKIKKIIKYGGIFPDYKPKKVERTI